MNHHDHQTSFQSGFNRDEDKATSTDRRDPDLETMMRYVKAIYADTQKIKRFMFWRFILNLFWVILVIAPIIVAFVYLPPMIKNVIGQYQNLLDTGADAWKIMDQLQQFKSLK